MLAHLCRIDDPHVHTGVCADEELVTGGYDDPRVGWSASSQLSDFAPPVGQVPETYNSSFIGREQGMAILTAFHSRYGSRVTFEKGAANSGSIGGAGVPHEDVAIRIPRDTQPSQTDRQQGFQRGWSRRQAFGRLARKPLTAP